MTKEEIKAVFGKLGAKKETSDAATAILLEIVHFLDTNPDECIPEKYTEKLKKLRTILDGYYTDTFPGLKKRQEIYDYIFTYKNYEEPTYIKYILSALVLTDKSPWSNDDINFFFTRILTKDPMFEFYNLKLLLNNDAKRDFRHFVQKRISEAALWRTVNRKLNELDKSADKTKKHLETIMHNYIAILGLFAAIISFIFVTTNIAIKSGIIALPLIFVFAGILFLFALLLKFLSSYDVRIGHWILIGAVCLILILIGLYLFYTILLQQIGASV